MGMSQQKKAMIKQRLTSSVSIFLTSPYLIIRTVPRAAMPTTTIDQPTINHLKKSDTELHSLLEYWNSGMLVMQFLIACEIDFPHHAIIPLFHRSMIILRGPGDYTSSSGLENLAEAFPPPRLLS